MAETPDISSSTNRPDVVSNSSLTQKIQSEIESLKILAIFNDFYNRYECFRVKVNAIYQKHKSDESTGKQVFRGLANTGDFIAKGLFGGKTDPRLIANFVFYNYWLEAAEAWPPCAQKINSNKKTKEPKPIKPSEANNVTVPFSRPFDDRIERLLVYSADSNANFQNATATAVMPFDTRFMDAATFGYLISEEGIKNTMPAEKQQSESAGIEEYWKSEKKRLGNDPYYMGVKSLINTYSLTRLYGSNGGSYLVDKKGERKWYEIDGNESNEIGYSKVPSTTSIINWGEGDPYGRTPYHFTDFVFCKYWGIIPNNRMITLRRYPAPIVDNLNFPTMDGNTSSGTSDKTEGNKETILKETANKNAITKAEGGSNKKINFPPMATVITYFGEETGNTLSSILKFTTGMTWGESEAAVHDTALTANPNADAGAGGLNAGLTSFAKILNVTSGNYNVAAGMNKEQLPPDPYSDGPYDNRVIGPVNAITKVKKRERGIEYTNPISLVFEYTARPIGGINSKAVLLDILSNFLLVGSVNAMFWGGQHRFVGQPQAYPFIGGKKGMDAWYRGDAIGFGKETIKTFATEGSQSANLFGDFFNSLMGLFKGANLKDLFGGGIKTDPNSKGLGSNQLIKNITSNIMAERSNGQVPYLMGHKALLTGEPVGEWHLTVGNPLNPIALIGNLICQNMEVEFGDELGPDDFPLNIKITVNLDHGMARDRDGIQSMFNRGQGRIYSLPDNFAGSADFETKVDRFTGDRTKTGRVKTRYGGSSAGVNYKGYVTEPSNNSKPSVWSRLPFATVSDDHMANFRENIHARSEFRSVTWISEKSLK